MEAEVANESALPSFAELRRRSWAEFLRKKLLPINFVCVVSGFIGGNILREVFPDISEEIKLYIHFPGEILSRMLELVTLPLLILGTFKGVTLTKINIKSSIKLRMGIFWLSSTLLAVTSGLLLCLYVRPNTRVIKSSEYRNVFNGIAFMNLIINLAPANLVTACLEQPKTVYGLDMLSNSTITDSNEPKEGFNTLSLILITSVYGLILRRSPRAKSFVMAVADAYEVIKFWITAIIRYMPVGLISYCLHRALMEKFTLAFFKFVAFVLVAIIGLLLHGLIILPGLYGIISGRNPYAILKGMYPALVTALFTSSSVCTQPVTNYCLEKRVNISKDLMGQLMPLTNDICKDGSVLYNVMAITFIVILNRIRLNLLMLFQITVGVTAFCMRTPTSSELEVFTTLLILSCLHIHHGNCVFLVISEFVLDRLNKAVNVVKQSLFMAMAHNLLLKETTTKIEEA